MLLHGVHHRRGPTLQDVAVWARGRQLCLNDVWCDETAAHLPASWRGVQHVVHLWCSTGRRTCHPAKPNTQACCLSPCYMRARCTRASHMFSTPHPVTAQGQQGARTGRHGASFEQSRYGGSTRYSCSYTPCSYTMPCSLSRTVMVMYTA